LISEVVDAPDCGAAESTSDLVMERLIPHDGIRERRGEVLEQGRDRLGRNPAGGKRDSGVTRE